MSPDPQPKTEAPSAPSTPATKPAEKTAPEMVDAVLYPAYPAAGVYCESKKIAYKSQSGVVRTKVRATIPKADFEALRVKQKGCVGLAS